MGMNHQNACSVQYEEEWSKRCTCNDIALFHIQPLLPYCLTVWNPTLPPQHINTTLTPDGSFQTTISVVSSDNVLGLLPSSPFFTAIHACGLLTCSFMPAFIHITCSSVPAIICLCLASHGFSHVSRETVFGKRELKHYCDPHKYHYNTVDAVL